MNKRHSIKTQSDTVLLASNYGKKPDKNLLAMARHLVDAPNISVVISANNKHADYWPEDLLTRCTFIRRRSVNALWLIITAKAILYTHSLSDAFPYAHRLPGIRQLSCGTLIFLQHGIIGLKKILANGRTMQQYITSLQPTFDYMIVSSEQESAIVEEMGIDRRKIKLTGLPRFDTYETTVRDIPESPKALIFLTWDTHQVRVVKLDELETAIRKHGNSLSFEIFHHPMVKSGSEKEFNISDYSLLITDDSSIAWDFFYTKRQVFFYKPSEWIINPEDLQAMIANDASELAELLTRHLNSPTSNLSQIEAAKYHDTQNCARVTQLIVGSRESNA